MSRIVPLDTVFSFDLDSFLEKACKSIRPYLPRMSEHRFHVRLERRGLKGQIVSPDIEQALDNFILDDWPIWGIPDRSILMPPMRYWPSKRSAPAAASLYYPRVV